jgi:UDP-N-acetyl-D-glucosamine dehydrogenase
LPMQKVGVIGLGYVGLPLAVAFANEGTDVVGVDSDASKVALLRDGQSYIEDVPADALSQVRGRFRPTTRYADLAICEAVIIAVPTPLTANREPDLGPLRASATALARVLQAGQLVVLESTTYPGTTRERLIPLLEESGLRAGRDFSVAFSPERIDPGRTDFSLRTTPKVVAGFTTECRERAVALYEAVCDTPVPVAALEVAEMTKLLENVYRSVNIALVNELAIICDRMEIDIWEVVEAAATKPYGFMSFKPGPGMGGHCLPVDPFYLAWRAREFDLSAEFIELAGEVNQRMPYYCAEKITAALNDLAKPVRGSRIAVVGVSYKAGVGDMRESPALVIMELLRKRGAELRYHDPYVGELQHLGLRSEPLGDVLDDCDCAVIVTAHPGLDVERTVRQAPVVVDFRGVTRGVKASLVSAQGGSWALVV